MKPSRQVLFVQKALSPESQGKSTQKVPSGRVPGERSHGSSTQETGSVLLLGQMEGADPMQPLLLRSVDRRVSRTGQLDCILVENTAKKKEAGHCGSLAAQDCQADFPKAAKASKLSPSL